MKNGIKSSLFHRNQSQDVLQCEEGPGLVAYMLTLGSFLLVTATLPFSLFFVVKVVQVKIVKTCHEILHIGSTGQKL